MRKREVGNVKRRKERRMLERGKWQRRADRTEEGAEAKKRVKRWKPVPHCKIEKKTKKIVNGKRRRELIDALFPTFSRWAQINEKRLKFLRFSGNHRIKKKIWL